MNLHDGGYPMQDDHVDPDLVLPERIETPVARLSMSRIWTDTQLGSLLGAVVFGLKKQVQALEDLCMEGLTLDDEEHSDLMCLKEFLCLLQAHARQLSRNGVPSLVDRRRPIKHICEHGLSEEDTTSYYVGRSGVTRIVPYIERGEAWLAVYKDDQVHARVPAKAMIITYKEAESG